MKHLFLVRPFLMVVLLLLITSVAFSQTAQLTGRVSDAAGAVVPGAQITVTNVGTGISREAVSNDEGYFTLPLLNPGEYRIAVKKDGFKPLVQPSVTLQVNQVARLDYTLETGGVTETVSITAATTASLETETSSLGKVVDQQRIQNLPLLGRNPYSLAGLVPGARPSAGANDLPVDIISQSYVSINGARGNQNEYLLDGAPNTAAVGNQPVAFVNPDAVQEFKVETNNFSAQYGRAGGGIFNIVTRSGTNDFHGTLYDYLRNDKLNANTFFGNRANTQRPPFRFNQFGATLGGPIDFPEKVFGPMKYNGKNRSFFFFSYEGVRFSQGGTYIGTVPTLLQRAGDFSQTRNAAGTVLPIYDPFTTRANPNAAGQFLRDPFPGNVIPRNRFDPVFVKMLEYIPLPNTAGNAVTAAGNYVVSKANLIKKDTFSVRLDHNINEKHRMSGRFNYDDTPFTRPDYYNNIASPTFGQQLFLRRNFGLDYTGTFSPSLVGNVLFSFTRLENNREPFSSGFDITSLGFPAAFKAAVFPISFPTIVMNGFGGSFSIPNSGTASLIGGNDLIRFGDNTGSLSGFLTKTLARHTLKFGGEYRLLRPNFWQFADTATNFTFTPGFTQGPNPTTANTGSAFASFMLGTPASGQTTIAASLATQVKYYGGFVQDDWKVTNNFTLNLGLRYEYESPRTERYNQLTNFDFNATPPVTAAGLNLKGALSFVGLNGAAREHWNPDRNNFSPRLGFAWNVLPKTVVRGGGGLFYAAMTGVGGASQAIGVAGFEATTAMVTSLNNNTVTPLNRLSNPYPTGLLQPTGSQLGARTLLGQNIRLVDRNQRTSYSAQWNLNIQRELPGGWLAEVGYAGNHGLKLQQDLELNQIPDSALALGTALQQSVPNPFAGQITAGPLAAANVTRAQLLRPYPHFQSVVAVNQPWASSNYHALIASLQRRFSNGLSLNGSYTFSKLIDLATGTFAGEVLSAGGFQNWNNLRADRALSALDAPHRFVVNGLYALPFGEGRKFNPKGAGGVIINGWEVSAIYTYQSGGPLLFSSATNTTFSQGGGQRPNLVGNPVLADDERTIARWFNTSAFAAAPAFTFGSAPRSLGNIRSDVLNNMDFSVVKNTRLREGISLQFRSEFFNLTNIARFAPPNTTFGSAQFGQVTAQQNQPRVVQFALKLIY